ncbi:MAG: helix-turn-helix transcriptional regulator [Bacillota bacterium]|nr:helix-turn-helix transcriptional regulator [Bacillota bacterium]
MRKKNKRRLQPLGKVIKKRLIEMGMTQKELASQSGTSEKYLNLILYGERSGIKYISIFEEILGIELESYKKSA